MNTRILLALALLASVVPVQAGGTREFAVLIESNVDAAKVYIDDTYFGETPLSCMLVFPESSRDSAIPTRDFRVRLEAEGYAPSVATITLRQEFYSTQRFFVEMFEEGVGPATAANPPAKSAQPSVTGRDTSAGGADARSRQATRGAGRGDAPILTVLDFKVQNLSPAEAGLIVDLLSSALFQTRKFRVIERDQRQKILEEIEFSKSDCADERCQLEIGKLLSADRIVVGTIGVVASRYVLNVKLLDVETGETVNTAYKIYQNMGALVDGCEELAFRLSEY